MLSGNANANGAHPGGGGGGGGWGGGWICLAMQRGTCSLVVIHIPGGPKLRFLNLCGLLACPVICLLFLTTSLTDATLLQSILTHFIFTVPH